MELITMNESYRITIQDDKGGPSGILVATAEVAEDDIVISFSNEWEECFHSQPEELERLKASLLNGDENHVMQGYSGENGLTQNAWRLYITKIG
jgi:hypothetical protein